MQLAVHDLGGDGPPLLMAHATGFCGRVLAPLAEHLRDHFHCWAFDARGHGDTITPAGPDWDWSHFADDTLAVVDGLGLVRPYGFGHSSGGAAMLDAEARRRGTFASLWCFEPIVWPEISDRLTASREPLIAGALRRRDHFPSREDAYDNFAAKPPLGSLDPAALRAYVDCGFRETEGEGVRLRCPPAVEAAIYRAGLLHDGFARLPQVACPVTVGRGASSRAVEVEVAQAQVAAMPHAVLARFEGMGHFGPLEQPGVVGKAVMAAFVGA